MALSDVFQLTYFGMMSVNVLKHNAAHLACILFSSLYDGEECAFTHISTGKTFNQAWTSGSQLFSGIGNNTIFKSVGYELNESIISKR